MEVQGYDQPRREVAQSKVSNVVQTREIRKEGSRRPVKTTTDTGMSTMEGNGERMVPGEDGVTYGTISQILRRH